MMEEAYWANTPLSIARHYGGIKIGGSEFLIVNKEGKDLFECSEEAEREGRDKAIEPGEPADLVRKCFIPFYKKLGRDRFIEEVKKHPGAKWKEILKAFKEADRKCWTLKHK